MDEWDRISHCITQLNQSRAIAETNTLSAISSILAAIDQCKHKLDMQRSDDLSGSILAELLEESEQVDLVSRKRDESVHAALSQLKQAVNSALGADEDEREKDDLGIVPASPEELSLMDRALSWHFLHEGYLDTARTFLKETGLNCIPDADLLRVKTGLEAVDIMTSRRDLGPAISWLENHSSLTSNLLFDLHRLRFLQLASSQTEAIGYAQRNFKPFADFRSQEIQTLLGGLLFHASVSSSHSAQSSTNVVEDRSWQNARLALLNEIRRPYCSMSVLISTGSRALSELREYQKLMMLPESKITRKSWTDLPNLPVQVKTHAHFHSEFWCPITQEQTDNHSNPPMLLTCGHVVAKSSISRIAKSRQRFKCPTCPTEQSVEAATPIHF